MFRPDSPRLRFTRGMLAVCTVFIAAGLISSQVFGAEAQPSQPAQPGAQPGQPAQPGAQPAQQGQPGGTQPAQPAAAQPAQSGGGQPAEAGASEPAKAGAPAATPEPVVPVVSYEAAMAVDDEQLRQRTPVTSILRSGTLGPGDDQTLRAYYTTFALPRWTVEENFTKLPDFAKDLQNELKYGKSGAAHDLLAQLVLDFMSKVAKENRPPVVRFNAMLAIAELNAVDSPSASSPTIASPAALMVLLDTLNDPNQIDVVKVAALYGLARQASLSENAQTGLGDPQVRAQVIDQMRTLATTKAVPKRSADGHAWMRAQAVEVLGNLKLAGAQGQIANTLADVIAEDPGVLDARTEAARALGKLNYNGVAGLDPMPLAVALTGMAARACDTELKRYEEAKEAKEKGKGQPGGYGYGMPMGLEDGGSMDMMEGMYGSGYPGMGSAKKKSEGMISLRRLKSDLGAVLIGLQGYDRKSGVGNINPASQEFADKVLGEIKSLVAALDDEDADDETLAEIITQAKSALAQLAQQPRAVAAAPAAAGGN